MLDDTDQLEPWVLVIYAKDLLKKKELMVIIILIKIFYQLLNFIIKNQK